MLTGWWKRRSYSAKYAIVLVAVFVLVGVAYSDYEVRVPGTSQPGVTPEVAAALLEANRVSEYEADVTRILDGVVAAVADLDELVPSYGHWDLEEQTRVDGALAALRTMEPRLKSLSAPTWRIPIHTKLLEAASHFGEASRLFGEGFGADSVESIREAGLAMNDGIVAVREAADMPRP